MKKLKVFPKTIFVFCIFYFVFTSCSDPTSKDSGKVTFSGTVTLEGQTDHSDVTVSLYEPVELDTAIARINQEYPNIGVQISQETEFDHREHDPVATTTTNTDGSWQVKVEEGVYNVVAEKDGYGWKYIYEKDGDEIDIELNEEISLQGIYSESVEIAQGSFVTIDADVTFLAGTFLTINPGTVILFKDNNKLDILGQIIVQGSSSGFVKFFADNNTNNSNGINLENANANTFQYFIFQGLKRGLYIKNTDNVNIENALFRKNDLGFELDNSKNINTSNCVFYKLTNGIITNGSNLHITKNIFLDIAESGLFIVDDDSNNVWFNVFERCMEEAIAINKVSYATQVSGEYGGIITYNDFKENYVNIFLGKKPSIISQNNNFFKANWFSVYTDPNTETNIIDFTQNFWSVTDEHLIDEQINDYNDRTGTEQQGAAIDYSNFSITEIIWP